MSRITVHLPDAVRDAVQRRVDAGEAPSLSAWAAAAVERALDGEGQTDPSEAAALQEQIAALQGERDAALARCGASEEERDASEARLHAAEVRLAAAEARCEAQQDAAVGAAEHVADLRAERDRLRSERDRAAEELRQWMLPAVVEQPDAPRSWLDRILPWWKQL